jgi:hypothetical protein
MRRHLTYANLVATFALLFAMSGGAIAAKHYLVNSTAQINPKVLGKLRAHSGPPGPQGNTGPQGKEGATGKEGPIGRTGLPGPVSVTRVDFFEPTSNTPNRSTEFKFLANTVTEHFSDPNTAAYVTGSLDIASSDGKQLSLALGICEEPLHGSEILPVARVTPEFTSPEESFFAQSISGVATGLTAGDYVLGVCTADETANVLHGDGAGTVLLAQTAEGGTTGVPALRRASSAQPIQR